MDDTDYDIFGSDKTVKQTTKCNDDKVDIFDDILYIYETNNNQETKEDKKKETVRSKYIPTIPKPKK